MPPALDTAATELIADQLAELRRRLLDLTNRNHLLNFVHSAKRSLRFTVGSLGGACRILVEEDGGTVELLPLPTPAASIQPLPSPDGWAQQMGIPTGPDLAPADEGNEGKLQTLLYREALGAHCRFLSREATKAIEETGANMLFLVFGFLRYPERPGADNEVEAPLLAIPVMFEPQPEHGPERYRLRYKGEDIAENFSLRERLRRDFDLTLPPLPEDERPNAEEYLRAITQAVETATGFRVLRRLSLCILNLSNMLMVRDLDPANWANGASNRLLAAPLINLLLGCAPAAPDGHIGRDDLESADVSGLPLAFDADASQLEALAAALLDGRNMVIQGPPGTGKSQTIANLLGACIAAGKTALFISEKEAALDVVRDRMKGVGLDPFALKLHSIGARADVLDQLQKRQDREATPASAFEQPAASARRKRDVMAAYTAFVNDSGGNVLGLSFHRALGEADLYRQELGACVPLRQALKIAATETLDNEDFEARTELLERLAASCGSMGPFGPGQPFWGFFPDRLVAGDEASVREALVRSQTASEALRRACGGFVALAVQDLRAPDSASVRAQRAALQGLRAEAPACMPWDRLPALWIAERALEDLVELEQYVEQFRTLAADVAGSYRLAPVRERALLRRLEAGARGIDAGTIAADAAWVPTLEARLAATAEVEDAIRLSGIGDVHEQTDSPLDATGPADLAAEAELLLLGERCVGWRELKEKVLGTQWRGRLPPRERIQNALNRLRSKAWLRRFGRGWRDAVALHQSVWPRQPRQPLGKRVSQLDELLNLWDEGAFLLSASAAVRRQYLAALMRLRCPEWLPRFQGSSSDTSWCRPALAWVAKFRDSEISPSVRAAVLNAPDADPLDRVMQELRGIESGLQGVEAASVALNGYGTFQPGIFAGVESSAGLSSFAQALSARLANSIPECPRLGDWSRYVADRRRAEKSGLAPVLSGLETVPVECWGLAYRHGVYRSLSRQKAAQAETILNGEDPGTLSQRFRELDREAVEKRGPAIAQRAAGRARPVAGTPGPRVSEMTEESLIRHCLSKPRARVSLRSLMLRSRRALQQYMPCFMMSPQAVAQYLPRETGFDLVVMDEASQLLTERALGAVARGAQLVVVGDSKQLPPTPFFQRLAEEADEQEATAASASESILDLCQSRLPVCGLRWHYRSRHPSLIAFSNLHFYDDRLIVFPSPKPCSHALGVRAVYLRDACYDARRNRAEADKILDLIAAHIAASPTLSLGVVTMNHEQMELIDDMLVRRCQEREDIDEYYREWKKKRQRLFVKNLENAQGDERDVILVSTTYGRPPNSQAVPQRFGPVSREDGWRRLNVLFTRARDALIVVTSLRPEDIVTDGATPRGARVLRDYLEYIQSGNLARQQAGAGPESPFEEAVLTRLQACGYEVVPQLGVAGYRLDLAVRDPRAPGYYLAGIECDGASYHSARTVRDRDRIRQEVIEAQGWRGRLWRIWSTEWFRDPEKQMRLLREFLEKLKGAPPSMEAEASAWVEETVEAPHAGAAAEPPDARDDDEPEVRVGDTVTYERCDRPGEPIVARIVARDSDPDRGVIGSGVPLAQALLGAAVGEETVLRIPGAAAQPLRVVRIMRPPPAAAAAR